jgi:tRNA (adenine22-N1)-methyltransferase
MSLACSSLSTGGPRLQLIFEQLLPGLPVWDFCCDHGYLGEAAVGSRLFPEVHFVDQVPSIIERLEKRLLTKYILKNYKIKLSAAENLQEPVFGNVIIAGVGGHTILEILQSLQQKNLLQMQRLILGPHRDEGRLLQWLQCHGKLLSICTSAEYSVPEGPRLRKIIVVDRTAD